MLAPRWSRARPCKRAVRYREAAHAGGEGDGSRRGVQLVRLLRLLLLLRLRLLVGELPEALVHLHLGPMNGVCVGGGGRHVALTCAIIVCVVVEVVWFLSVVVFVHFVFLLCSCKAACGARSAGRGHRRDFARGRWARARGRAHGGRWRRRRSPREGAAAPCCMAACNEFALVQLGALDAESMGDRSHSAYWRPRPESRLRSPVS